MENARMKPVDDELSDVLITISVIAKRLARILQEEEGEKHESQRTDRTDE